MANIPQQRPAAALRTREIPEMLRAEHDANTRTWDRYVRALDEYRQLQAQAAKRARRMRP